VGERRRRGRLSSTVGAAAALALLVSRRSPLRAIAFPISDDPYTDGGSGHQHKTQAESDSFAYGSTIDGLTQSGRWYGGGGASNLVFSTSTDGGTTWGGCTLISSVSEHGVAANIRTFSLPSAEVAGDGRVYVAWQDCRFRSGCTANDIVYSTSICSASSPRSTAGRPGRRVAGSPGR
jgi:hypothetical protein